MSIEAWPHRKNIPEDMWPLIDPQDGVTKIYPVLLERYSPESISSPGAAQDAWTCVGLYYRDAKRLNDAITILHGLYDHMLQFQIESKRRVHKGMPLVWLRDCHLMLGHTVTAKRYAMLTLCEDAIRDIGRLNMETGGIYFRLLFDHGLPSREIHRYAKEMYALYLKDVEGAMYPEYILQDIDNEWISEYPNTNELFLYTPNRKYISYLLNLPRDKSGLIFERLAEYLLSVIPGFRTYRRQRTPSTDYDIVCANEGFNVDFRSELWRYIICECKDWNNKINFSTIAKFCRVLDSTKCKGGIVFSRYGFTGRGKTKYAERERLKVFQDRGMAILLIDLDDIRRIEVDENLITLLRRKYEQVRLDLSKIM